MDLVEDQRQVADKDVAHGNQEDDEDKGDQVGYGEACHQSVHDILHARLD